MDCSLGVFLSYILMWIVNSIAEMSRWSILQSGFYFEEYFRNGKKKYRLIPKMYFSQLGVWLVVTIINKLLILVILKICHQFLENFGNFVLNPFSNGKVRLVMVMIIFPVILNAIYFWITDNILKFTPDEGDKDVKEFYEQEDKQQSIKENNGYNNNHKSIGEMNGQRPIGLEENELIKENNKHKSMMEMQTGPLV